MPFAIPGVQPKGELIDISPQVFRAGMMVNTVKPPFQGGPHAVDAVRGHAVFIRLFKKGTDLHPRLLSISASRIRSSRTSGARGPLLLHQLLKDREDGGGTDFIYPSNKNIDGICCFR